MIMKTAAGYNVNRIITYTITQHIAAVLYSITKRCLVSQVMKEEKRQHKNITCLKSLTCSHSSCCYKLRLASTGINQLSSSQQKGNRQKKKKGEKKENECNVSKTSAPALTGIEFIENAFQLSWER